MGMDISDLRPTCQVMLNLNPSQIIPNGNYFHYLHFTTLEEQKLVTNFLANDTSPFTFGC